MEQVTIKTYVESQKGVNSLLMMVNVLLALSRTKNTRLLEQGLVKLHVQSDEVALLTRLDVWNI